MGMVMKTKTLTTFKRIYHYEGEIYLALVSVKKMKSKIRLTYYQSKKELHISILPDVDFAYLDSFVTKALPTLVNRAKRKNAPNKDRDCFYILGKKLPLEASTPEESLLLHKKEAKAYFLTRLRHYESLMGIASPYKLSVRKVSSRFGSNSSRTHRIMLSLSLYSFSEDCIDSVVVHELAHDSYRNHGKRFYAKVLRYCPAYWELRKRLLYNLYSEDMKVPSSKKEENNDDID